MRIGISINGVLRNYFKQIEQTHSKYFPSDDDEDRITVLDYDFDKWIKFPTEKSEQAELQFDPNFDPFNSVSRDSVVDLELTPIEEQTTIDEFLYEKCTLEIFGAAEEMVSGVMNTLNNLVLHFPQHEFVVMSREVGLSVPSTYFFLSKTSCMVHEVKFVMDSTKQWDFVDMMVTDHPDVINSKPQGKSVVIVDKDFNKSLDGDFRIDSIKSLSDVLDPM